MNLPTEVVPSYRLTRPLVDETIAKLVRSLGDQSAAQIWGQACKSAGCRAEARPTVDELIAIGQALGRMPGLAGVYGNSLAIRARTFRSLSAPAMTTSK